MIEVPAILEKSDIPLTAELHGKANSKPIEIGDAPLPFGTGLLRFVCFAGALNLESGFYEGVYRFEPCKRAETENLADLTTLPNFEG